MNLLYRRLSGASETGHAIFAFVYKRRVHAAFFLAGYNPRMQYVPGQRWISNAEPELGLGTVLRVEGRTVQLAFPATGVVRQYSMQTAPLTRSEFRPGERVSANGDSFVIEKIESHNGLLQYFGNGKTIAEGELDDMQNVSKADARLIAGRVDSAEQFEFRLETLTRRADSRRSNAFGLMSSRIDLIPHQLRVAEIASSRHPPRVLLADEVGLGKTIEAGMILARLLGDRPRFARDDPAARSARVSVVRRTAAPLQSALRDLRRGTLRIDRNRRRRAQSVRRRTTRHLRYSLSARFGEAPRAGAGGATGICSSSTKRITWPGRRKPRAPNTRSPSGSPRRRPA